MLAMLHLFMCGWDLIYNTWPSNRLKIIAILYMYILFTHVSLDPIWVPNFHFHKKTVVFPSVTTNLNHEVTRISLVYLSPLRGGTNVWNWSKVRSGLRWWSRGSSSLNQASCKKSTILPVTNMTWDTWKLRPFVARPGAFAVDFRGCNH